MHPYIIRNEINQIYLLNLNFSDIEITITKFLYKQILQGLKIGSETPAKALFMSIPYKKQTDFVVLSFPLPFITYPNYSHKKLNWKALNVTAERLGIFFELLYLYINFEADTVKKAYMNQEHPQLLSINVGFHQADGKQYPYIGTHFSPKARALLQEIPKSTDFSEVLKTTYEQHLSLIESNKREFRQHKKMFQKSDGNNTSLSIGFTGSVPIFTVPGSCACLGSDPDNFSETGTLIQHNIFSSLELITMILLLINFDHEILEPLYKKSIETA